MIRTGQEMKQQAENKGITGWVVRNCSMCYYPLAYYWNGENVEFDSGCDCTGTSTMNPRSWDDLAETYNMNQPERNERISREYLDEVNKVWQFKSV